MHIYATTWTPRWVGLKLRSPRGTPGTTGFLQLEKEACDLNTTHTLSLTGVWTKTKLSLYVKYILVESGRPLRTSPGPRSWVSPQNPLVTSAERLRFRAVVEKLATFNSTSQQRRYARLAIVLRGIWVQTTSLPLLGIRSPSNSPFGTQPEGANEPVYNVNIPVQYAKPFGKGARIEKIKK